MSDIDILGTLAPNAGSSAPLARGESIMGVAMIVANTTARDAIPAGVLRNGQLCLVVSSGIWYQWNGSGWVTYTGFGGSGSGLNSVTTVATANVASLSGLAQTINGVALNTDGMTILLPAQTTASENGPWVVHSGVWTRPTWFAVGADAAGVVIVVQRGTALFDTTWLCTANTGSAVIGTNNLVFVEITEAGITVADGTTLQKIGLVYAIKAGGVGNTELAAGISWAKLAAAIGNLGFTGLKSLSYTGEVNNTGATPAIDFTTGDLQKITATANCAPTFVAPAGIGWVQICFIQDTTPRTFTQPGSVTGSPPQPSTVSGSRTFYQYFYDGTNYHYASADTSAFALVDGSRAFTGGVTITQAAVATGSPAALKVTGGAHTTLTASTQAPDVDFALARTVQFATGAIASQRAVRITAPTYAFVGASTISDAATVAISGAPVAGTLATLTRSYALWVESGVSRFDGNVSFGAGVTSPKLFQEPNATNGATAQSLLMQAQNAIGTTSTGGSAIVQGGSGTSVNGGVSLRSGSGNDILLVADSASQYLTTLNATAAVTAILQFADTSASALAYAIQAHATGAATGRPLVVSGQGAATTGGALILASGGGSASTFGALTLQLGGYVNGVVSGASAIMFEMKHLAGARRITSLNYPGVSGAGVTTTEMPANTGDLVTFVGDAANIPAANGVNGHIYYSDGAKPAWRFNGTNLRFNGTSGSASAGAGSAPPATVEGYLDVQINGTQRKMPYYAA